LYATLHAVKFVQDLLALPPLPPKRLFSGNVEGAWKASDVPLLHLELEEDDCHDFEVAVKEFLYGGVGVWRLRWN
jgi:hypothetical protein